MDRYTVAQLEQMMHSEDVRKRMAVAREGYRLNVMINDPHEVVRTEVAERGFGLDVLQYDDSWRVRKTVASKGIEVDYLDHFGRPLASVLDEKVYMLMPETKDNWAYQCEEHFGTIRQLVDFSKHNDFSKVRGMGQEAFEELCATLQPFGIDCSEFVFAGKTIDGKEREIIPLEEVKGTLQFDDSRQMNSPEKTRFGDTHIEPEKTSFLKRLFSRKEPAPVVSEREAPEIHEEEKTPEQTAEKTPEKSRELPSLDELKAAAEAYRAAHPWQSEPTRERVIWDKDRE